MPPTQTIQTVTNQYLAPVWHDLILRDNMFAAEILGTTKKWQGSQHLEPIKYQKGVATIAFNGFDQLPVNQQPVSVNMTFYSTFTATNVALAGSDLSVNKTPMQTMNLLTTMMISRAEDGADDVGNFFQGDGTGFGGKAPAGLGNIVDNGTNSSTYGGLSRATYSGLNATVTAAPSGKISLLLIRQIWNSISDGRVAPNYAITNYDIWAFVEQLLQAFQRNMYTSFRDMDAGSGYESGGLIWANLKILHDKKIGNGLFYLLNRNYLNFYGLDWYEKAPPSPFVGSQLIKGNIYEFDIKNFGKAFTWTGFIKAFNQGAINGFMIMGGQLYCTAPLRNGKITGVTGI